MRAYEYCDSSQSTASDTMDKYRVTLLLQPATLGGAVAVLASCASLSSGARDHFVHEVSCPADRVTVVANPEVQLLPDPAPPPDVAADPARLALWRQQRDAARKEGVRAYCRNDLFEVTGCGQRLDVCCYHPDSESQYGEANLGKSACTTVHIPTASDAEDAARINAPSVFNLPAHTEVPAVPASLRGFKVLLDEQFLGATSSVVPEQTRAACAKDGALLAAELGWVLVVDRAQPHDLVWRPECNAGRVTFLTSSSRALYLLLPKDITGSRFETPDGQLIDQEDSPPTTVLCPAADQAQCATAFASYIHAFIVGGIARSTKLADYAAHRPGR